MPFNLSLIIISFMSYIGVVFRKIKNRKFVSSSLNCVTKKFVSVLFSYYMHILFRFLNVKRLINIKLIYNLHKRI